MRFDCLDASYQLISELRRPLAAIRRADGRLAVQLRTAAASIALNVAEGRAREGRDRRHHWRIARGSAEEVSAILKVAESFGDVSLDECHAAHETLTRVHQMLWRMTH
ncbi:MAG: four helix bundle protein [Planctomycetes bacterium]|nr:four helix bundle protein [Planctomycetota bacterium]